MCLLLRHLALAAFCALFAASSASALALQPYMLSAFLAAYGVTPTLVPGASVTIYVAGTSTRANLYTSAGAALSNPVTTDVNGFASFYADSGSQYQATWSVGSYTSPIIAVVPNLGSLLSATNIWSGANTYSAAQSFANWTLASALSNFGASAGKMMGLGSPGSAGHSTSTPDAVDLGNDYSSTNGANPKLTIYNKAAGAVTGLGYSAAGFDFIVPSTLNMTYGFWINSNYMAAVNAGLGLLGGSLNLYGTGTAALVVQGGMGVGGALRAGGAITGGSTVLAGQYLTSAWGSVTLSSCGTSPSVASGSSVNGGSFTFGSGTVSSCAVTFTGYSITTNLKCVVSPASSFTGTYNVYTPLISPLNNFAVNLSTSSPGATFNYVCYAGY